MHEKYKQQGLVAMSVALADPKDEEAMKNVREYLKLQKANFQNFVLDEAPEDWQDRLGIVGPPVVFVFGPDGRAERKFDEGVDYQEIEKVVKELLEDK